jgi:hypothetical protein
MKITINTITEAQIELPLYFKPSSKYSDLYFMTIGEKSAIRVTDQDFTPENESLYLYPIIEVVGASTVAIWVRDGWEPISEAEFKAAYMKVSLALESLLN